MSNMDKPRSEAELFGHDMVGVFAPSRNLSVNEWQITLARFGSLLDIFYLRVQKAVRLRLDRFTIVCSSHRVLEAKVNADCYRSRREFDDVQIPVADDACPIVAASVFVNRNHFDGSDQRLPIIETLDRSEFWKRDRSISAIDSNKRLISFSDRNLQRNAFTSFFKSWLSPKFFTFTFEKTIQWPTIVGTVFQPEVKFDRVRPKPRFKTFMNSSADLVDDVRTEIQSKFQISDSIDHVNFGKVFLSRVNQFKIHGKEAIIKCRGIGHGGVDMLFLHLTKFKFDSTRYHFAAFQAKLSQLTTPSQVLLHGLKMSPCLGDSDG